MKVMRSRARTKMAGLAAAVALAAGGMAAVATSNASHVTARPAAQASTPKQVARARAALTRYLSQSNPTINLTGQAGLKPATPNLSAGPMGNDLLGSFNWSGYADSSGTTGEFTAVSATWREPYTLCTPEQRLASFWVGLDGLSMSDPTVEQDGTLAYCFEGHAYYFSWWEMYPAGTVEVGPTVQPGDLISASVTRSGTSYTLALTDYNSPSNSFSTVQTCALETCLDTSAEWIAERPEYPIGIAPLTYFSDLSMSRASQTSGGDTGSIAAGPDPERITMIDATSSYALAVASGLSRGSAFTARWLNSY
jgi:hypothetical protein